MLKTLVQRMQNFVTPLNHLFGREKMKSVYAILKYIIKDNCHTKIISIHTDCCPIGKYSLSCQYLVAHFDATKFVVTILWPTLKSTVSCNH